MRDGSSPALRLVVPDEEPLTKTISRRDSAADLDAQVHGLVEFFHRYAWPSCMAPSGDCQRTRKEYLTTLGYWQRFTDDPPIGRITQATCQKFARLLANANFANATLRKHTRHILYLLDRTGPKTRQNPDGAGLVDSSAWLKMPRKQRHPPRPPLTLAEIHAWMAAARHPRPTDKTMPVPPPLWWRSIILFGYNTGLRISSLVQIAWEHLDGDHRIARMPPGIVKRHMGHLIYLNQWAREVLDGLPHREGPIFPWAGWPVSDQTLHRHAALMQDGAGIRPLRFQGLRRAFSSYAARINNLAAQMQMGHEGPGMQVMTHHYLDFEVLAEALERLPQPGPMTQAMLF